ncbi:hypothetical protein, partial [Pseudomonas fluorescens]
DVQVSCGIADPRPVERRRAFFAVRGHRDQPAAGWLRHFFGVVLIGVGCRTQNQIRSGFAL